MWANKNVIRLGLCTFVIWYSKEGRGTLCSCTEYVLHLNKVQEDAEVQLLRGGGDKSLFACHF